MTPEPELVFELRNNSSEPIWLDGFSLTNPLYEFYRLEGGKRIQIGGSMSATGAQPIYLASGMATVFRFELSDLFLFDQGNNKPHNTGPYELTIPIGTTDHTRMSPVRSNPFS